MTVIVRMWTKDRYHKDVLVFDDQQTRMTCVGIEETVDGIRIDPKVFPEATHFTIVVNRYDRDCQR
jgi:hypothetical protein